MNFLERQYIEGENPSTSRLILEIRLTFEGWETDQNMLVKSCFGGSWDGLRGSGGFGRSNLGP